MFPHYSSPFLLGGVFAVTLVFAGCSLPTEPSASDETVLSDDSYSSEESSFVPDDQADPPQENILTDARLKGSFPIRITTTMTNGKKIKYEFADPYTWRTLDENGTVDAISANGRIFLSTPNEGWISHGLSPDEDFSFHDIMGIPSLLLDDPASLALESLGSEPCIVATGTQCEAFRWRADNFKVWLQSDTRLLDHWTSDESSIDVAYGVNIGPISPPASFKNLDGEMRQMMRANGISEF